jgi:flagellar biosynthetic protein FlhB
LLAPWMFVTLLGYAKSTFASVASASTTPAMALAAAGDMTVRLTLPVLGAVAVGAILATYVQVGSVFSLEPFKPQLSRLNPLSNLKQLFGSKALVELAKSLVKVIGLGLVAGDALWSFAPRILSTLLRAPEHALALVGQCFLTIAWRAGLVMVVVAAADYLYQRWSYFKRLRMTKEEVKREQKEGEGDPQHKAERQRLHREMLQQQMFERTREADCVIINPQHVAVAIKYDREQMNAPQVIASGRGLVAAKIRQLARQAGVPLVRNVPLARALVELELDDEVPGELYEAVAEVLRFVYRLSEQRERAAEVARDQPEPPFGSLRP